jgi:NitT/TauT family transport system substrate-binding protein
VAERLRRLSDQQSIEACDMVAYSAEELDGVMQPDSATCQNPFREFISRRGALQSQRWQTEKETMQKIASSGLIALTLAFLTEVDVRAADIVRVGEGPFIAGGGYLIAREKGYFKKLDIEIQPREFQDGALAVPSMIAGEIEITTMTPNAALFNSVAKGAALTVILDRGTNRPGFAYTVVNVTQALYDQGVKSLADFGKLKGKKVGVSGNGSINQYYVAKGLVKAGLDPAKDVQWIVNVPQPDLMRMLGQGQVDVTDLAYQFGFFAKNNKWGPIIVTDDQIEPNGPIATYAIRKDYLEKNREVVIRWATAYLQGVKEFNAAAQAPDQHPEIIDILAKNTALNKSELVKAIAPNWGYLNEEGSPPVDAIMEIQDFWGGKYFNFVEKKIARDQLFDVSVAKEAKARLDRENPFGP